MIMKKIGLMLLLVYSVALVGAAIPHRLFVLGLGPVQSLSDRLLAGMTLSAGMELFYRPFREDYKIRSQCIRITGETLDGKKVSIKKSPLNCDWFQGSAYRFRENIYETMFQRFVEDSAIERSHRLARARNSVVNPNSRAAAIYRSIGDFYCKSKLSPAAKENLKSVLVAWNQNKIGYEDEKAYDVLQLVYKWNCETRSTDFVYWYPDIPLALDEAAKND